MHHARHHFDSELLPILAAMSDAVWCAEVDAQGLARVVFSSPRVKEILGQAPSGDWLDLVVAEDRDAVRAHVAEPSEEWRTCEYQIALPSGGIRWVADKRRTHHFADGRARIEVILSDRSDRKRADEAEQHLWTQECQLRQSQQLFEAFMNNIPLLAFMKDHEGRMVYINQSFSAKFGPAERLIGKLDDELWSPDIAAKLRENDLRVLAGAKPIELREHVATPDGVLREWWVVKFPFRDAQGRVFLGGVGFDLSERRQLEEALRRSEARYRQLWQRNLAGGFRAALDGRILDCNDAFARLFGFQSRADMLTRSTRELYFDLSVRERFLEQIRQQHYLTNYELLMRRADGTPIWVLENVALVRDNGEEWLEGTIIDISDRKRAEEALRASENNYRTLINHLDQAIFLKDRDLRYVTANPVFCAAVNMDESELRGKTIRDAYPSSWHTEKSQTLEQRVLTEGRAIENEETLKIAGQTRAVRIRRTPVRNDMGDIVGVLGICWDVTAQREIEAQLRHVQKMDAIGQLAGGIAHDFNNLLTIMLGNLSYILSGSLDLAATLDLVRNVEKAGLRAAELTQTLLGFSRRATTTVAYNLNDAVDEVVKLTRTTLPASIKLEVCADPRLWLVQADPGQMNQVLMNLTLNARDAMPQGGKIQFETAPFVPDVEYLAQHVEARAGEFVRLRVRDTGSGIPRELRQRIFEPFFTTKERGKGTGMGLATVFSIVKQHDGWIVCDSEPGLGTTFDVFLPRHDAAPTEPKAVAAPPDARDLILVVDDEAMIRQLAGTILRKAGYPVVLAEDGASAIEICRNQADHIALIILDAVMPRLSGRQTLSELARVAPQVDVIYSSGFSTEQLPSSEFPQVRRLLPKPYRAEQLLDAVVEILNAKRRVPVGS